jgi:hypothetical protein
LHESKLVSWHCTWQDVFASAVQVAVQLELHFVAQSSVAGMVVHVVSQWSSQQAPHDAWQSVMFPDVAQFVVQFAPQREPQSLAHVVVAGVAVHVVVQSFTQLVVHESAAVSLHWALHDCSSLAAQQVSKLVGSHCVSQTLGVVTSLQLALAVMSMLPQAEMPAWATRGATVKAARPRATMDTGRMML